MSSPTIASNARLYDLFELLFQDLRAFGVFACHGRTPKKDLVNGYIKDRLGTLNFILQAAERFLGTALENISLPILANTMNWPEGMPIAGYKTDGIGINYSQLLSTYSGNWVYEYSHGPYHRRLIRAGLWMWYKNGFESAIQYLFDLQKYGYFTIEQGVEDSIAILIASRASGRDIQEIVRSFFRGKIPTSNVDWMKWDIKIPKKPGTTFDLAILQPILEFIILDTLEEIENTRDLDSPVEWLLCQAACATRCGQVMRLCKKFPIKQTVMLKSILSQFEEIFADGSVYITYKTWAKFSPLKSPLSLQASYLTLIFSANFGEEGLERLYHDRLIYPATLHESLSQYGVKVLRENKDLFQWSIIPPRIFHPYAALFSTGYPDSALRVELFPIEQILEIPIVRELFEQHGIHVQEKRIEMLNQVYFGRLNWSGRVLDSGEALEVRPTEEQKEQLLEVLDILHRALCHEELENDLIASIKTSDRGEKEGILNRLRFLYPWNAALYQELAIFCDESGDPQQAWNYILTAVLLEPDNAMIWQSLGVISNRLGDKAGAQFAQAMNEFFQERNRDE